VSKSLGEDQWSIAKCSSMRYDEVGTSVVDALDVDAPPA
jgi:hypothetical protein